MVKPVEGSLLEEHGNGGVGGGKKRLKQEPRAGYQGDSPGSREGRSHGQRGAQGVLMEKSWGRGGAGAVKWLGCGGNGRGGRGASRRSG